MADILFYLTAARPVDEAVIRAGGEPLLALCQEEVDRFDAYLCQAGESQGGGLIKFERRAIAGYLYQKLRGRLDAQDDSGTVSEGADGSKTGS